MFLTSWATVVTSMLGQTDVFSFCKVCRFLLIEQLLKLSIFKGSLRLWVIQHLLLISAGNLHYNWELSGFQISNLEMWLCVLRAACLWGRHQLSKKCPLVIWSTKMHVNAKCKQGFCHVRATVLHHFLSLLRCHECINVAWVGIKRDVSYHLMLCFSLLLYVKHIKHALTCCLQVQRLWLQVICSCLLSLYGHWIGQ